MINASFIFQVWDERKENKRKKGREEKEEGKGIFY
jgi:hypothetical protein